MSYLLSVIIPTKDRYPYLKECIKTIVDIGSDDIEIVVQDNTLENYEILAFIKNLNWNHIKYFHTLEKLSQTENSEKAVEHSTGEYVCYIGDDDSVAEIIIDVTKMLKRNGIDACNVNMSAYYWPDVRFSNNRKSSLSFDKRKVKANILITKKILTKYLKTGMQDIRFLPRVYHSIISRNILEKVKILSGSYFPGPSPDIANASVASLVIDWHLMIRLPVIISGTAFNSAAGKGLRGAHKGKLSTVSQIASDVEKKWNPMIPRVWLGNTIWPESSLKALKAAKAQDYIKIFNYFSVYARICLKHREYIYLIKEYLTNPLCYLRLLYEVVKDIFRWIVKKMKIFIKILMRVEYVSRRNISLAEACFITNEHNRKICNIDNLERQINRIMFK